MQGQKYDKILEEILNFIERRDGKERIDELREEIKTLAMKGMMREMICQLLLKEGLATRFRFMASHPGLIVPYLMRIRHE